MSNNNFFRPALTPSIYAYEEPGSAGLAGFLKIVFTKPWTDEKLYTKYGITAEEQAFIESMIRPMEGEE